MENIVVPWYSFDRSESLRLINMMTMTPPSPNGNIEFYGKNFYLGSTGKENWQSLMFFSGVITSTGEVFLKYGNRSPNPAYAYHKTISFYNDNGKVGIRVQERLRYYKRLIQKDIVTSVETPPYKPELLTLLKLNRHSIETQIKKLNDDDSIKYAKLITFEDWLFWFYKIESLSKDMTVAEVEAVLGKPHHEYIVSSKESWREDKRKCMRYYAAKKESNIANEYTDIAITFDFLCDNDGEYRLSEIY